MGAAGTRSALLRLISRRWQVSTLTSPLLSMYTPRDLIDELNKDVQDTKTSLRRAEALAEERRVLLDERQVLLDESRKVASAYKAELEQLRAEASEFRRSKQE